MPARDTATTPHLRHSISGPSRQGPQSPPPNVGPSTGGTGDAASPSRDSPGAIRKIHDGSYGTYTSPPNGSNGGGGLTNLLKRASGEPGPGGDEEEARDVGVRRKRSQDLDDRYHHLAMSSSSQAIRDSSHRLASLSFTSSHISRPSISSGESPVHSMSPLSSTTRQVPSATAAIPSLSSSGRKVQHQPGASLSSSRKQQFILPFPSASYSRPKGTGLGADSVPKRSFIPSLLHETVSASVAAEGAVSPGTVDGVSPTGLSTPSPKEQNGDGDLKTSQTSNAKGLSGLSMMMERERAARESRATSPVTEAKEIETDSQIPSGTSEDRGKENVSSTKDAIQSKASSSSNLHAGSSQSSSLPASDVTPTPPVIVEPSSRLAHSPIKRYSTASSSNLDTGVDERSPLLPSQPTASTSSSGLRGHFAGWRKRARKVTLKDAVRVCVQDPVKTLPPVILGVLLNVLDGVSYGMILFPPTPVFKGFGSLGVSMFFVSCIVSQLVFSLGGSIFPGGNGSMMIEAVPFFHILVNIIQQEVGDDNGAIIATTMVAFAFSSILTGLVFFALGAFRLGTLVGYFPRHILVGCIGGVGIFLLETGLEVTLGLKEEGFQYDLPTLRLFFSSVHSVLLWTIPLFLAILLRIVTHFFHHQLIFPAYFFLIPVIFYIVIAIGRWSFDDLRRTGWVFDVGTEAEAWWKFYTYFDFGKTSWSAFWAGMPTQLALVFFGILHVPLNVPALGVSLCEDNVKLDRELVAHGVSNLAAGLTGTVPNYLTYVNSILFYRVGGGSRLSGIMLAIGTTGIMIIGPSVIGYLPVMVVGALIYVLGIDLLLEAVWDTRHRVNRMEYITIWAIAIGMTVWDFVIGLLFGIILACVFFVVQNSRRRAIRAVFSGSTAKSTVRRPRSQRAFIQQVGSQTYVIKLQGFLFFGTISAVEEEIRTLLDIASWTHNPIRFLVLDFALVPAMDFSSAEAFARVQRLLSAKNVLLILCGASPTGLVGKALQGVGLWADKEGLQVEVFESLNEALEWTENAYLTAFYESRMTIIQSPASSMIIDFPKVAKTPFSLAESFQNSPRRTHLAKAGGDTLHNSLTLPDAPESPEIDINSQPLSLLLQTLGSYLPPPPDQSFLQSLIPYFRPVILESGTTLWTQSDPPDGLYLIESGSLRATYTYDDHTRLVQETMVAGTIAGDLSTLSETRRNATVVCERQCVVWKLDLESLGRMEKEEPEVAMKLVKVVLKAVVEEEEVLTSHLIALLS